MNEKVKCTLVAFYDLDISRVNIRGLFLFLEEWMLKLNYVPQRGSVDGEAINSSKTWTYKHTKKLIETRKYDDISGFWFACYPPQWDYDMTDGVLYAHLKLEGKRGFFDFYFSNKIIPHDRQYIISLIQQISLYLTAGYGIVLQRELDRGPSPYAVGITMGLDDNDPEQVEEEEHIAQRFRAYCLDNNYSQGCLRDIYEMNLLTGVHLNRDIYSTTLRKWIESSPEHGELQPLTDTLWEWWVPDNKIVSVREALRDSGIIICI